MLLNLLRTISYSHLFGEKLRTALSIVGVSLGIALYSAIRLANFNAFESFANSAALLRQGSELSIVSKSGRLDESVISLLRGVEGIAAVNPIASRVVSVQLPGDRIDTAQIFGMDLTALGKFSEAPSTEHNSTPKEEHDSHSSFRLFARPPAALVSPQLREELRGAPLQMIVNGENLQVEVAGELADKGLGAIFGSHTVLLDIAAYQEAFQDFGKIDELELKIDPAFANGKTRDSLIAHLPPNMTLTSASGQQKQAEKFTAAFRLNLNFLAGISLLVGLLLIYNSISYTSLKRRAEFGVIRTLGGTKRTILLLLAIESLALGVFASAIGLALGYGLSFATVKMVGTTFTSMYLPVKVAHVAWSAEIALEALLIGPTMTLLAAILPIIEALATSPRETFAYQNFEDKFRRMSTTLALLSVVTLGVTLLFAQQRFLRANLLLGFVAPTFLVFTGLLLVPKCTELMIKALRKASWLGFRLPLALDHVSATLKRNSVAIASVAVALGMFIGMTVMISSFRGTVTRWIEHITTADLYISTGGLAHSVQATSTLPERAIEFAITQPEVTLYDWVLKARVTINDSQAEVFGARFQVLAATDRLLLKNTSSMIDRKKLYQDPNAVLASESFATKFHVAVGDVVRVPTANGETSLTVSDIFYDYTSEQGVLMIPDQRFTALFGTTPKESLSLYLASPADDAAVSARLQQTFPEVHMTIRNNETLRAEVLRIFDQTFRITYGLRIIALVISGLTIFNTILILIIERAREFAILRAIGASTAVLKSLITTEALFLGFASSVFGSLLGMGLALLLVFVVNKFFFGWSVEFSPPLSLFLTTGAATMAIAWFVAAVASLRFKKSLQIKAIRYE